MANALYLVVLLASLVVWDSVADDACDSVECLPSSKPVCALNDKAGNVALFANECVMRCINCRMASEFKKVNSSLCSAGTTRIAVCPDSALSYETRMGDHDDGIAVVQIDLEEEGSGLPPSFGDSPLPPLPLLSVGSELLRRLAMSSHPEPPPPAPQGITLITADVKVNVTINMNAPPPPPPAAHHGLASSLSPALALAMPRMPLLVPPPPPPPQLEELRYQPQEVVDVYTMTSAAACPSIAAAVASLVALTVAAIHI